MIDLTRIEQVEQLDNSENFSDGQALGSVPGVAAFELTPIARVMVEDLEHAACALHVAPQGCGKSFSAAQAAATRFLAGAAVIIAVPTVRLARECMGLLKGMIPQAFEAGAVVQICGQRIPSSNDDDEDEDDIGNDDGKYPINAKTRIIICSHQQLMRRGFSCYVRSFWDKIGPERRDLRLMPPANNASGIPREGKSMIIIAVVDHTLHFRIFDSAGKMVVDTDENRLPEHTSAIENLKKELGSLWPPHRLTPSEKVQIIALVASIAGEGPRPAFELIVDEAGTFINNLRVEIPVDYRYKTERYRDGTGWRFKPLTKCPKSSRSGNCNNCTVAHGSGGAIFNCFGIRELAPPRTSEYRSDGQRVTQPRVPVEISDDDLLVNDKIQVSNTVFAARVLMFRDIVPRNIIRAYQPIEVFERKPGGDHPSEDVGEILESLFRFAYRGVLVEEHPVDRIDKTIIDPDELAKAIRAKSKTWFEGVQFPYHTCQSPHILFEDLMGLEKMRRHSRENNVGIVFTGANMSKADYSVLHQVFPDIKVRKHPYSSRKIRQAAVVFSGSPENPQTVKSLVDWQRRLVTGPLEEFGRTLICLANKGLARDLYDWVKHTHPSARFAIVNDSEGAPLGRLHGEEVPLRTWITYSRGVFGLGANLEDLVAVVVDALAFRSIASFNPETISREAFQEAQAEERLCLILQNLGRALHGEEGKLVTLFVLNADVALMNAIKASEALREGCELPPVFAPGDNLPILVEQSRKWLAAGGGAWPAVDPEQKAPVRSRRPKRTWESILAAAKRAIASGMAWKIFARKHNVNRLSPENRASLKARFEQVSR